MKRSTILAAMAVVAAGVAGVFAAQLSTTRQTTSSAQPAVEAKGVASVAGSIVAIDENGNRVTPTAKQIKELQAGSKSFKRSGPAKARAVDPNDPSKGIVLENIPPVAAAARINADGKLEAICLSNEADALKFIEGGKQEVAK
jgi:hypothetical protein